MTVPVEVGTPFNTQISVEPLQTYLCPWNQLLSIVDTRSGSQVPGTVQSGTLSNPQARGRRTGGCSNREISNVTWNGTREIISVFITTIHSDVLENLSHTMFLKPNYLNIKLGTRLYRDETNEGNKARTIQTA